MFSTTSAHTSTASSSLPSNVTVTTIWSDQHSFKTRIPRIKSTEPGLDVPTSVSGTMTVNSPVTMVSEASLSRPPSHSPVTQVTQKSSPAGQNARHTTLDSNKPTALADSHQTVASGHTAGGADKGLERVSTYIIGGKPVVAGASATVISRTTYSLARYGGELYVDGTSKSIVAKATRASASASVSSSGVPVPANGSAASLVSQSMMFAAICGLVGLI